MPEAPMPLWEVFIRNRSGFPHKHAGSVHATDAAMALQAARDVYTRRGESVSIWVIPSSAITASDPAQRHDPVTVRGVWFGTQGVELRMGAPSRTIRVTVRDQDGAPVERFELRRIPAGGPRAPEAGSWVSPPDVHPGGEASIGASETPFRLRVASSGFEPADLGPFTWTHKGRDVVITAGPFVRRADRGVAAAGTCEVTSRWARAILDAKPKASPSSSTSSPSPASPASPPARK